jgi:hypothetical protein
MIEVVADDVAARDRAHRTGSITRCGRRVNAPVPAAVGDDPAVDEDLEVAYDGRAVRGLLKAGSGIARPTGP